MMYDENFLKDFAGRASENYKQMKGSEYEVTALFCSFSGLLSVLDENVRKDLFRNVKYPIFLKDIRNDLSDIDEGNKSLSMIRHLRNSLCHLKIDEKHIRHNEKNEITSIILEDINLKNQITFSCELSVSELEELFFFIANTVLIIS